MNNQSFINHQKNIIAYWKPAVDWEGQGIWCNMEPGCKCLLMHMRQLYNYSAGAEYGLEGAGEIADHLYAGLDKLYPAENGLHPSSPRKKGSAYDHFYVVSGLSRYARYKKDAALFTRAYELLLYLRDVFTHDDFKEKGLWGVFRDGRLSFKSGNVMLHHYESLINLYDAYINIPELQSEKIKTDLLERLTEAEDVFYTRLYDPVTKLTPDELNDDLSFITKDARATLGHPLEWWGFLYEAELLTGRTNNWIRSEGMKLVGQMLEYGLGDKGCLKNLYDWNTGEVYGKTDFWTQIEAVLALSYVYHCTGEKKYLKKAELMWDFYDRFMIDHKWGGVFTSVNDEGTPLSFQKGGIWKCDHHSLRVCERMIKYNLLSE